MIAVFLSVFVLLTVCQAGYSLSVAASVAADEYSDCGYRYDVEDGKARITGVQNTISGDIVIPSMLGGYPVTKLGACSFSSIPVTSVIIPDTVTVIDGAFCGNKSLVSVTIPDSVVSIESDSFYNCFNLSEVNIPDSVTFIGKWAFCQCTFSSLFIPKSVTFIDEKAFAYCCDLESISVDPLNPRYHSDGNCLIETETGVLLKGCDNSVIPDDGSVTSIGTLAFSYCGMSHITIPDSVTVIGKEAFKCCYSLTSVTIGSSVAFVDSDAFGECKQLIKVNYTGSIADWCAIVFDDTYGTHPMTYSILMPPPFTNSTFYINDQPITHLVIPDTVTTINYCAFFGCRGITAITLPKSVTSIGDFAIGPTMVLEHIWYEGSKEDAQKIDFGNGHLDNHGIWHYNTCKDGRHLYDNDADCDCNACEWVRDVPAFADFTQGDIDLDGVCTASDLLRLRHHILYNRKLSKVEITAADRNGDGEVNILDLIRFKKELAEYSSI